MNPDPFLEEFPLNDQNNIEILMHREAHFSGSFKYMLEYYAQGGKGIRPEFEIENIRKLAELELTLQVNLAATFLTGPDAEKVALAKTAYKKLRDLYEKEPPSPFPILIADLIFSEEEIPAKEIEAIVHQKSVIVPSLVELLKAEEFYDPLFPGYGQAPSLAARCLGLIGDKRAIISLFEAIGQEDFFNEDILLESLKLIGEPAKTFLLHVVKGRPINFDNERAAIALIQFKDDPEVALTCFELLMDPIVRKDVVLCTYLVLACEGLTDPEHREKFLKLAAEPKISSSLRRDLLTVSKCWTQAR